MTTLGLCSRTTRATFKRFSQVFSTRPSGISSACRHDMHSIFAASAASRARSSALPRVPISPWVKSRIPVRYPRCAIFSSVPPQVCSTSSRCAAMARMSRGVDGMSVKIALFQNDILAHDETVCRHLLQHRKNSAHVFVGIHEGDDDRKFAAGLDHVRGFHAMPPQKSSHGMKSGRGIDIFLAQVVENLHVQRPVAPLVGFVEIDCDLYCHSVRHSTALAPGPCLPKLRRDTA